MLRDPGSVDPCWQVEPADVAAFGEATIAPVESADLVVLNVSVNDNSSDDVDAVRVVAAEVWAGLPR
ncbi:MULTISPECIES: hypothetical protein [Saccharothrix]|uniref:hypothetical protein n=1 Tax=Saccharothrix TaxID=2071 RepID=UPI00093EACE7|nr:hypothetical protein [Saccharothrix sp. CB00851]OKI15493.1 hypothetical protein A6A25_14460 [Saccharothrix sp. CB00851]